MLADPGPREDSLGAIGAVPLNPRSVQLRRLGRGRLTTAPILLRHDLALDLPPELERAGDPGERFLGAAGAGDRDRAVIQEPPENALIYPDRLDLAEQGFD